MTAQAGSGLPGALPATPAADARTAPILRTAAALLSVQGITWISTLAGVLIVPRLLGPQQLGNYSALWALANVAGVVAAWGTGAQTVRSVARDKEQARDLVAHAIALRLSIFSVFIVGGLAFLLLVSASAANVALFAVLMGSYAAVLAAQPITDALQGNQTLGRAALLKSATGVVGKVGSVAALVAGGGVIGMVAVDLVGGLIFLAVVTPVFLKALPGTVYWSRNTWKMVATTSFTFFLWEVSIRLYAGIDYLLLRLLADAETVGQYAFAYKLAAIPIFASTVVTAAIYAPLSSAAAEKDMAWFRSVLTEGTRVALVTTLPMATGLIVLAPGLVSLIGGSEFEDAGLVLAVLACHLPIVAAHSVLGAGLFALDRQRFVAVIGWLALGVNALLNLAAIPLADRYLGNAALGAGAMMLVSELAIDLWIWRELGDRISRREVVSTVVRCALACVIMAGVVWMTASAFGTFAAIPAGVVVYGAAAIGFRLIRPHELRNMRREFGSRGEVPSGN
jgi:O-antigen/teichoic acid export membrane protein